MTTGTGGRVRRSADVALTCAAFVALALAPGVLGLVNAGLPLASPAPGRGVITETEPASSVALLCAVVTLAWAALGAARVPGVVVGRWSPRHLAAAATMLVSWVVGSAVSLAASTFSSACAGGACDLGPLLAAGLAIACPVLLATAVGVLVARAPEPVRRWASGSPGVALALGLVALHALWAPDWFSSL